MPSNASLMNFSLVQAYYRQQGSMEMDYFTGNKWSTVKIKMT
ncbi:hypothetical protein M8C21_013419 [Ambrosia artemisiifolia]|uniref:Uncharacterized protein n=1 Tax=Ambrosia artemisiifolia TaxID=4212 RepID=A0AAD5GPD7_AMBAR|nr:hypothetical protein M8C21_013419 [Ambrosia artemisiifolia]